MSKLVALEANGVDSKKGGGSQIENEILET